MTTEVTLESVCKSLVLGFISSQVFENEIPLQLDPVHWWCLILEEFCCIKWLPWKWSPYKMATMYHTRFIKLATTNQFFPIVSSWNTSVSWWSSANTRNFESGNKKYSGPKFQGKTHTSTWDKLEKVGWKITKSHRLTFKHINWR